MRKLIVFVCLGMSLHGEPASRGALVEALFILQNKCSETQSYVRELKKSLTESCLAASTQDFAAKKTTDATLGLYHNHLQCIIYPDLIKELEELQGRVLKDIECLAADNPQLSLAEVKEKVDFAFLLKDKVSVVSRFLSLIFDIDKKECELEHKQAELKSKQKRSDETAAQRKSTLRLSKRVQMLQKSISYDKKRVRSLRSTIRKIDKELYPGKECNDRLFLHKVTCFKG